ncbi:hypothetical protein BC937DRAFT_90131 [Endogone sp. FLAS-F59071]|nr:hypothetical protein BC937DRAFT_90131 [Endogone sp. FLAS-F59071]|eukprot:RUS17324.1 hypothetical protein BC937DRAFT_90131 [Endogone sp. FLAS-F59071]
MPIFTPAFPSNCVTHTVTRSTQIVLITEFEKGRLLFDMRNFVVDGLRFGKGLAIFDAFSKLHTSAASIVNEILRGECMWSKLFEPYDFFHAYKYYIRIVASSGSADEQKEWSYKIESSIRHFISSIEFVKYVKYAHPFPVPFNGMRRCVNKQEMKTAQLEGVIESEDNDEDIDDEDDDWKKTVYTTAFWIGVAVEKKSASSTSSGQQRMLDLSWPTTDFINMVKAWDDFDEESMTVNVSYIRRLVRDIPLEVVDQAAWPKAQRREARGRQQKEDVEDEEEEEYEREEEEDEQDEQNEHNLAFANPTIGDVKTADVNIFL